MFGASIGRGAKRILDALVDWLAQGGVHPNVLTLIGVCINVFCGLLFGFGQFFWAGIVLIFANLFDMLDGNVARRTNRVSRFGAFFDSSLDRLSDMVSFVGIMFFYATNTPERSLLNVFLAGVGLVFSVMISYTSARAESLIPKCDVGFLRRPERIVLLIIGALSTFPNSSFFLANRMPAVLWILALTGVWTFIHRMIYTWIELNKLESETANAAALSSVKKIEIEKRTENVAEKRSAPKLVH
jgi:CDP-diacylglycerol--glycerol-3-phosphate 3-phosphatidyltransferase